MRRLGYALLVALLFEGRAGAQEAAPADEAAENSEEGEAPGPQEKATEEKAPATPEATPHGSKTSRAKKVTAASKPKVGKDGLHWSRKPRKGAKLLGAVVPDERLRAAPPPRPS